MTTLTDEQIAALKAAALAATPQNIDSAQRIEHYDDGSHVECPACGGEGHVEIEADFCNYDGTEIGVQFYGIGNAHGAAEAYLRAAMPANVLALIERLERAEAALLSASKPAATQELPQAVLDALRFYAHGHHYNIDDDHQQFDTVSGEPQNWLFSERDDDCTMIEDGGIAKAVLLGGLPGFEEPAEPIEGEVFTAAPTFDLSQEFVTRASEDADAPSVIGNTIPAEPIGWKLVPVEPTVEMLNAALGHDSTFGHGFKRRIYQEMLAAAPAAPVQSAEPVRLSESDVAELYYSSAHDSLSGFTAKLNAALDRVAPQPSHTAASLDDGEAALVDDLSTLVVRLVRALRKASPDSDLPAKALEYLYRKDLSPSVLRGGKFGEFAAPSAVALDDASPLVDEWIRSRGTSMTGDAYFAAVQLAAYVKARAASLQPATLNPMLDKAERDISASQPVKLAQPVEQTRALGDDVLKLIECAADCISESVTYEQDGFDTPPMPATEWDYNADQLAYALRALLTAARPASGETE